MTATDDLTLRPAGPDDTEALCELIGAVFPDNPKRHPDVLRWQFWDNPEGHAVSWVAERDGHLVGHFAVLPVPATIAGRRSRLAKPADAATLPEAQGRGLMGRLAREVMAACAERDIPITMCLPNFRARGALEKIGMEQVTRLRAFVRPLDDRWVASRTHVPAALVGLGRRVVFGGLPAPEGDRVDAVPDGIDALEARTRRIGATGVVHHAAWWQWRYLDAPFDYRIHELREDGRLVAAAASRVRDGYGARFVNLLDLVADSDEAAARLVARVAEDREDAVGMATLTVPGSQLARAARAVGMRPLPSRLEPQPVILGVLHNDPEVPTPPPGSWEIAWCDHDHV